MPWREIRDEPEQDDPIDQDLKKRSRFLVDENLGEEVASVLRDFKINTLFVGDVGLIGHDDHAVFSFAWKEQRILLTHDRGFLDDQQYPEHRNPGVIILPGGDGNQRAMLTGIAKVIEQFSSAPMIWQKSKAVITSEGEISIRSRNLDSGKMETRRFRMGRGRYLEVWEDE